MPRLQMLQQVGYVRPSVSIIRRTFGSLLESCNRKGPLATVTANDVEMKEKEPLVQAAQESSAASQISGKSLEILRVRNRFVKEESTEHSSGGFRDLAFKVKVGFQVL